MRNESRAMYDFYPESWGPASHDPENPSSHEAVQAALERADDSQRPDDN